ncbi:nucleolar protein dao-5 [Labrus bergylta]|uniref:nucleolar protein dao-5 n=1 Tax=Labrus bergylta TaxID=56723 RepID=UPI003313A18D
MKPDGVTTAALEPMETLESNPMNEAAPAAGQEPNQAASPVEGGGPQQPAEETGQGEPQPDKAKDTPAAKTSNKTAGDPKAKTANKTTPKAKPGTNNPAKTTPGSRTNTPQSRLSNGVSKPQTNGVPKKTPPAAVKKTTPTPLKKPTSTATALAPKSKVGEKKATGEAPATNGAKPMTGTTAAKRTPSTTTNGVKTGSTQAAAKKPPAPKLAATASTKPSSSASPKPPVSKTTRPAAAGSSASPRPATGSSRPPTTSTIRSSVSTPKPAAPKTSATAAKPAASKSTSTTPSGGKPPASLTSRNTTPVKRDVTKSAASVAKKPAESPLSRPSPASKSAKPETPKSASKSDAAAKKPTAGKAADTKTPNRLKTQDGKPTPSKDASKTPASKTKTSSPKKTVGSSTPTPVKRGPKAATAESGKEAAAAVAAAAAIATAAAVIASPEEPEPTAEVPLKQSAEEEAPEMMFCQTDEKTIEPLIAPESETVQPEPIQEPTPIREPTPEPEREISPLESLSQLSDVEDKLVPEQASDIQLPAQMDFKFEDSVNNSVQSLGTTVMSPPCSPPGPVSPVREPQDASSLLDMHVQSDPWDKSPSHAAADFAPQSLVNVMDFQTEEEHESSEDEDKEEKDDLLMPASYTAPPADAFSMLAQPQSLSAPLMDDFTSRDLIFPHEKEEAVEKADEEINEDDDEEEEDEDEEQRRLGHQPSSMITEMSTSQPSEEFQVRSSAFGGSAGWHGDDLLSGMDSEDVSSCTSSRQHEMSDLSSTQHTAILEGTQSSDALVDSSLRGSEGDCNLMGSPNVETLANEEEEDEDEEDERVDDMDLSSERVEEQQKVFQQREQEDEEDDDVEMHSEGVTESCGNVDEDDFNEEERLDNLNRSGPPPCVPPTSSWGQTNPFADTWAQPASLLAVSSPSPISDPGAAESETPTLSPAQKCFDSSAPSFALQTHDEVKSSETEEDHVLFDAPAVGVSQPGALSGPAAAAHSGSETSTPEDLRDYDSSSGVESHSDKQQTPVPAPVQPDMEQDLGIHLEKGDGEEEEAETLPADEVLGTGPPTAPASAPSSPSTSGDEASDTEGEMQINEPDAPAMMDESAGFESPPPAHSLPALDEDEESADTAVVEGEEDGGGTTPQSANSVASYGFDCTTSNSNAHSMAESCGKSPGIFSLENEEQLPEEAKDPSLIKELTLPSAAAAAQAEDLLGRPVDLMPFGHPPSLDEHHYMFGGKIAVDHLEEADPLEPSRHLGEDDSADPGDSQPPYYSTICDKTDSFLAGNV